MTHSLIIKRKTKMTKKNEGNSMIKITKEEAKEKAWKEYKKIEEPAWENYKKIREPALKAYKKIREPAWKEWDKTIKKINAAKE